MPRRTALRDRPGSTLPDWHLHCYFKTVRILVSNDDGIYSPGILALAEVAAEFGDVRVVAPDVERSSSGHAITSSRPLSYRKTKVADFAAYRVDGTPADCVALGSHLWGEVDLVLSGVNLGFNLGASIWHSGTLAAAKQAALLGKRGLALSAPATTEDFAPLKPWCRRVIETVLANPALHLVNVNLPHAPRGLLWTRVSVRQYDGNIVQTHDPMGRDLFWFTVRPLQGAEEGTDRWALEQDWISLTPLRLDLTDETSLVQQIARDPLDLARAVSMAKQSSPEAARSVREEESQAMLEASSDGAGADG
jgi:5'-nucleotidase